jgi:hypothetical protein
MAGTAETIFALLWQRSDHLDYLALLQRIQLWVQSEIARVGVCGGLYARPNGTEELSQ